MQNLVKSIAAGVPADTIAPEIRRREQEIARLEVRLKASPPQQPRLDELRVALLQRSGGLEEEAPHRAADGRGNSKQ